MANEKYLNSFARCPKCNTRLLGHIKITSWGDTIDLISFKKVTPDCRCTKCGQLFESRPHMRSQAVLSLALSVVIIVMTIPVVFIIGSLIHVSIGIALSFLIMWAELVLPPLLIPSYKPKNTKLRKKLDPTQEKLAESGDIYSRAGQL